MAATTVAVWGVRCGCASGGPEPRLHADEGEIGGGAEDGAETTGGETGASLLGQGKGGALVHLLEVVHDLGVDADAQGTSTPTQSLTHSLARSLTPSCVVRSMQGKARLQLRVRHAGWFRNTPVISR